MLHLISSIFVLITLLFLPDFANAGHCLLKKCSPNDSADKYDVYSCFRSNDLRRDISRLPLDDLDVIEISFRDGDIGEIGNDAFIRLGAKCLGITITRCDLEDVAEGAFRSLVRLKRLDLSKNQLTEVSVKWFHDLTELEILDLSDNEIQRIDPMMFRSLPLIREFDVTNNRLTSFDILALKSFSLNLKKIGLGGNRYDWRTGYEVVAFFNENKAYLENLSNKDIRISNDGLNDTYHVVDLCIEVMRNKGDHGELDECVKRKLEEGLEDPNILNFRKSNKFFYM